MNFCVIDENVCLKIISEPFNRYYPIDNEQQLKILLHFLQTKMTQNLDFMAVWSSCRGDPLEGLGDDLVEAELSRVDCLVFAEPLDCRSSGTTTENVSTSSENFDIEETVFDNLTVQRRNGKRKKLYVHLHNDSNLACPMQTCSKSFSTTTLLKSHIRKVHYSEKNFTCEVCGASFTAEYLLRRHSATHGAQRTQCPVCKKMLSLRTSLSVHLRSHANTRPHQCPTCHKRFLRRSTLNVHLKSVHKDKAP